MSERSESHAKRRRRSRNHSAAAAERPNALWPLTGICLIAALWLLPEAWRQLRADLATGPARAAITRIGTSHAPTTTDEWTDVLGALERAVEIAPDDGATQADLGALYGTAGLRPDISSELRAEYALSARLRDLRATHLRPTEPRGWAELARAELLAGEAGPAYLQAWALAAQLGPGEAIVQNQLLELVFATYPSPHTSEMKAWLEQLHLNGNVQRRALVREMAQSYMLDLDPLGRIIVPAQAQPTGLQPGDSQP